jgi:hypothetical protein
VGYYTRHELEVVDGDPELTTKLVEENEEANYALESDGSSSESCKWYDHEKHMREFSAKHPDALFKLSGEGEEAGDIWVEYYRGGKVQQCRAKIVFPDFDEKLLK